MALIISRMTIVVSILLLGVSHSFAQGSSAWSTWTGAALADSLQLQAKMPCASLVAQTGYEFSITTAAFVPVAGSSQRSCRVQGMIQPDIQFEVSLPATWNGRLFMFGNGGFAGESLEAPNRVAQTLAAVSRGFAVAQTNTGHDSAAEPLATFAVNRQKFLDYAYRAVHITAVTAKRLAQLYFGSPARRAYFNGCSTGGRQGLISAQRFPDDFDGIVVGAPVLSFSGTMIGYAHIQRALAAAPLSAAKLKLLADAVYAKCDAADGVKDGVIDDPRRCPFKASTDLPRCADEAGGVSVLLPGRNRRSRNDLSRVPNGVGTLHDRLAAGRRDCRGGAERRRQRVGAVAGCCARRAPDPTELRRELLPIHGLRAAGTVVRMDALRCGG